jgi:phosphate transport system substrate-binding protein
MTIIHKKKPTASVSKLIPIVFTLFLFSACGGGEGSKELDTPTSGEIWITSDETFSKIIDSEVYAFNESYIHAKVNVRFADEATAFKDLLNDSARLIIASRKLNENEEAYFKKIVITPRTIKIADDAVALILNKDNADTNLYYQQVKNILNGKITDWAQVNENSKLGAITIIFDNVGSSTARYMQENLVDGAKFPSNCYAMKSNSAVIDYVAANPGAIGVIGVNWISDGDDPATLGFLSKVKVAALSPKDSTGVSKPEFYKPYQAYIAEKNYPLCRELYIISREARTGLGTGFAAFVAGDKGQRIILKSGLMPATLPVRIVGFQ